MDISYLSILAAFVLAVLCYPPFIKYLEAQSSNQTVSEYALEAFKNKKKTVTFGGLIFVIVTIVVSMVFMKFKVDRNLMLITIVFVAYACIGFVDDYKIVKDGKNDGISPSTKMLLQLISAILFYTLYISTGGSNELVIPVINKSIDLGFLFLPFVMFLFSGASNAVNLTDGMDGLASGTSIIALIPFAYVAFQKNATSIFVFLLALIGALLGFLVFNRKPARIFMGDVGSLALGAVMASVAVLLEMELLFAVIGGVFVFETVTVIIQRTSWKLRKKRVFKYTPIHYTFTLNGWAEQKVVYFFYLLGVISAILGFVLIYFS